jgi:Zn-dependent protease
MSSTFPGPGEDRPLPLDPLAHSGPSTDGPGPYAHAPRPGEQFDASSLPYGDAVARQPVMSLAEPAAGEETGQRRFWLPVILFLATCLSTFFVGSMRWAPLEYLGMSLQSSSLYEPPGFNVDMTPIRRQLYSHWRDGFIYMACVIGILLSHEMGHFVMTLVYRVRSSYPYFIPLPITPIGTMGAVIAMDGRKANRKEIFDIGLAGPLAGLVVAIPILIYGTSIIDFERPASGVFTVGNPLIIQWMLSYWQSAGYDPSAGVAMSQANPFYMAGWVGLLVTGLNMMPVSQLDGGHVTYALLGRKAHWLARAFIWVAIAYLIITMNFGWVLMILLVLFIGTDHPPTSDDSVPLGTARTIIGWLSLLIPVLCFAPRAILM